MAVRRPSLRVLLRAVLLTTGLTLLLAGPLRAQRIYDAEFLAAGLDLEGVITARTRPELKGLRPRLDSLEQALGPDHRDQKWFDLQVFRVLSFKYSDGEVAAITAVEPLLEHPLAHKNTFATRALLSLEVHSRSLVESPSLGAKGIKSLLHALELSNMAEDAQMEFDLSLLLASIYIRYRYRDQAWEWLHRAKELLAEIYDPLNCHLYYTQAADAANPEVWGDQQKLIWESKAAEARALDWIQKAVDCGETAYRQGHELSTDMGLAYHIKSSYWREPAEEVRDYKKALPYSKKRSRMALAEGHAEMGRIYLKLGMMDSAKIYLDSSRVLATDFPQFPINLRRCYANFVDYYEALGDHQDSVYKYQMLYYKARADGTEAKAIAKLERQKFMYQEARQKVTILKQQGEIEARALRNRNLTLVLGGLGIISLLVLLALLRIRQRNRIIRQKNKKIKGMVEQLEGNLAEKNVLIQEVNHRVKNNLQMITAFVDLQSAQIQAAETAEFSASVRRRIMAVSLVHDLIVNTDRRVGMDFRAYVEELVGELESLYYKGSPMAIHCEIGVTRLDPFTVMYLGVLLNELVSNSMKHAVVGEEPLEIWLRLESRDGQLELRYRDSGSGLPEGSLAGENSSSGIGLMLIATMVRQLEGELRYEHAGGGEFILRFPLTEAG